MKNELLQRPPGLRQRGRKPVCIHCPAVCARCSNDSTALGVENSLAAFYVGNYPVITGQDCDLANVKNIIAGKQSMSVFKDTRTMVEQTTQMVEAILEGKDVPINDNTTYNNGVKVIPSFLCTPVFVDANNYRQILIESGYYTEDQIM